MKGVPEDISEMEQRINKVKNKQTRKNSKKSTESSNAVSNAFRIGTEFIAAVAVGFCFGFILDKFFGTKIIFILVFSLFGCMAGMRNVYLTAKEIEEQMKEEKN